MNVFDTIKRLVLGKNVGLSFSDINSSAEHNSFYPFLPYVGYDEDDGYFITQDDHVGFIWEGKPTIFVGEDKSKAVEAIIRGSNFPEDTVLSITLHADPFVDRHVDIFKRIRTRDDQVITACTNRFADYLMEGTKGIYNVSKIPLRNFRVIISLKLPTKAKELEKGGLIEIRNQVEEGLVGLGMSMSDNGVTRYTPKHLLDWTRRIFNNDNPIEYGMYDENVPIQKQIIRSDSPIEDKGSYMKVGGKVWRCMTPKVHSATTSFHLFNTLFGGYMGGGDDNNQIRSPFLYTVVIFYKDLKKQLHTKCNMVLQQKGVGSFAPSLAKKQEEYSEATGMIDRGINFMRTMQMFWVYDDDLHRATESMSRARRVWDANGFLMQVDRGILRILFISSLPLGCYAQKGKLLDLLERDFIVHSEALTPCIPIQGDYMGAGLPKMILIGRKGQLATLDLWAKGSPNMNALLMASSGGGKSYLANDLIVGNYASGSNIRILDIGRSYKKLVKLIGAKFLDFRPETPVSLNPFTFIKNPQEDLQAVVDVISLMAYASNPQERVSTIETNLIRNGVRYAWNVAGNKADTGLVYEYLAKFPELNANNPHAKTLPQSQDERNLNSSLHTEDIKRDAKHLAFQIQEFIPQGLYGGFFSGTASFDIRNDSVVVTELQELVGQPELYRVVTGLITNAYLLDAMNNQNPNGTMFLYDEAWQYLKSDTGGAGNLLAPMLERLARTARKHECSLVIITQSLLDIESFGDSGDAIWNNSAYKIFLQSTDLHMPKAKEILGYDDFTMSLLRSIESAPPYYSEMFIDSQFGKGVARLAHDHYTYFVNTSKGSEVRRIEEMVANGASYHEAIERMIPERIDSLFKEVDLKQKLAS